MDEAVSAASSTRRGRMRAKQRSGSERGQAIDTELVFGGAIGGGFLRTLFRSPVIERFAMSTEVKEWHRPSARGGDTGDLDVNDRTGSGVRREKGGEFSEARMAGGDRFAAAV